MTQPIVYDDTALTALFHDVEGLAFDYFRDAEQDLRIILFPALAVLAATETLEATESHWQVFLEPPAVHATSLSITAAITVGTWTGDLATRHVIYEARTAAGIVLTADPQRYAGSRVHVEVL